MCKKACILGQHINAREDIFNQFRFLPKLSIYGSILILMKHVTKIRYGFYKDLVQPNSQKNFPLMFLYTTFTRPRDGMGCITPTTTC